MTPKETYKSRLLDPRWQKKRLTIYARDKFTCTMCGDNRTTLAVHHTEYKGKPWEIEDEKLKTVCSHCHDVIHQLPSYDIVKIDKQINIEHNCWNVVVYTENQIIFVYLYFVKGDEMAHMQPYQIITLLTDLKP